ncbi:efflux RND transporter periplasmic adaptor subunit [Aeoliella sp. ICT_H6.2]|uniref:Efflux RND transporter periplasmic adaptor subunit n=1 Tax=Aeoliella straminimaris TaxID=2954799 RepID=A0A9X2JH03_9BACT|nr:efflux RND transporter periplasmic adaptor subunit [Aeoliella straminimaris]MCO6044113.1 efflux RND transporter periplasmic adaptor subunit [Aeoliella straminimaris]
MSVTKPPRRLLITVVCLFVVTAIAIAALATRARWLPLILPSEQSAEDSTDEHDHTHEGHESAMNIRLTERGLKNIGFEPFVVAPTSYERDLTLPAIVVERPGRSQIHVTAPLTGIVTAIHAVTGEAVDTGAPLFELRLTHEELVAAQKEFLESLAKLNIVEKELARLQGLNEGVVAGKRILEQQYEKQRIEVNLRTAEQAMLLHGLNEDQIEKVQSTGQLFRTITIRAPEHGNADEACQGPHLFTIQSLSVAKGEHVDLGKELAVLADHCELHIEALAFEDDAAAIRTAAENNRNVTANPLDSRPAQHRLEGLQVAYVASQIDPISRAFKVYVRLPNEVALDKTLPSGKQILEWKYKPGQRMQLSVPVETWENQLVLPTTAVVDEGAEAYAYRQNGDTFEQAPVHVLQRDQKAVVVANDGALFPGDVIAGNGAYQLHLAIKNKSGGAIDPHAGHNH